MVVGAVMGLMVAERELLGGGSERVGPESILEVALKVVGDDGLDREKHVLLVVGEITEAAAARGLGIGRVQISPSL